MKLAVNLDTLTFVNPENSAVAVRSAEFRRDDVLPVEVIFFKGSKRVELAEGATGNIQVNEKDTFGGAGLGADSTFDKSGTGVDSVYTFDLDLSGSAVDAAFTDAEEASKISAILEVKVAEGSYVMRTAPLPVTLHNAINQS